uniref:Uncharacterized protein n=1 Tax=Fagus sylvatica TaxID=28930 RepID=A0A2N9FRE5_FAGSY
MVDAIVYDLLKQLASITTQQAKEEIKLIVGVDQEVQELKGQARNHPGGAGRCRGRTSEAACCETLVSSAQRRILRDG